MNTFKNIFIITLISLPMISFAASGKLWERNMEKREAEKAPPEFVESAASKMNHTAVQHKRYILGENYSGPRYTAPTSNDYNPQMVHTDHMGVDHKRKMLGENR